MIKAAVLGSPISHSLSPRIHTKAYEILGLAADYQAFEVTENEFASFFAKNMNEAWSGFSLTMPLKEVAFKVADEVDVRAKRINSANTLYRRGTGWSASSTDLLAFDNLISLPIDSKVAIIGGGGTARAAAGALNSKVAAFDVLIRNPERLAELSKSAPDVDIRVLEMSAPLDGYDFVIQTTPSGVFDKYAIGLKNASGTLLECLYNPWPTLLAKNFLALGGSVISGKQLLVEQALFQIELFTQIQFDFAMMRTQLIAHIDEK